MFWLLSHAAASKKVKTLFDFHSLVILDPAVIKENEVRPFSLKRNSVPGKSSAEICPIVLSCWHSRIFHRLCNCRSRGKRPVNYRDQHIISDGAVDRLAPPRSTNSPSPSNGVKSRCAIRKNDIVILAVTQDLVPYAREVLDFLGRRAAERGGALLAECLKQQQGMTRRPQAFTFRSPRVVEFVLISEDHVEPCMHDFTEAGFLYAIVLTETNRKHRSCNLRILHTGEHQGQCFDIINFRFWAIFAHH